MPLPWFSKSMIGAVPQHDDDWVRAKRRRVEHQHLAAVNSGSIVTAAVSSPRSRGVMKRET